MTVGAITHKFPFTISMAHNPEMRAWDLMVQLGGFESEVDAKSGAKLLAEILTDQGGFFRPAQTQ